MSKKNKVVYVVSLFPCWSETFIVREIQSLIDSGHEVDIVSLKAATESLVHEEAEQLSRSVNYPSRGVQLLLGVLFSFLRHPIKTAKWTGITVKEMWRKPLVMAKTLATLGLTLDLVAKLRGKDFQRFHAHWANYPSTAAMIAADMLGKEFSFTCHAHDIFLENQLLKMKILRSDLAATISKFNVNYLRDRIGKEADAMEVVHCGINIEEFEFDENPRDEQLIVSVGRLDEIKGFVYLIDACRQLHEAGKKFQCVVVGEGPLRNDLQARITEAGLTETIRLVGAMPQPDVRNWIRKAAVFVLACDKAADGNMDGIPVVLMESMAIGTPVITTRLTGIPELVVNDDTGVLCEPRGTDEIAQSIDRLLGDPSLRKRLALSARAKVEADFNCKLEAQKLVEFWQRQRS